MKKFLSIIFALCIIVCFCSTTIIAAEESANNVTNNNFNTSTIGSLLLSDDKSPVYISYDKSRYQTNETITVKVVINDMTRKTNISYDTSGFEILRTQATENDINVSLKFTSKTTEAQFTATVKYGEEIFSPKIFALSTDKGIFLSINSIDSAWDSYFYSGVTDGEYSFEEYDRRWNKYMCENSTGITSTISISDTPVTANSTKSNTITVTGLLRWKDDSNVYHPMQYNKVCIYDDTTGLIIATGYTNVNGNYTLQFSENNYYGSGYVIIYPGGVNSIVTTWNGGSYAYYASFNNNVSGGQTATANVDIDMSTTRGQAFQISQAVNVASEYAKAMEGSYLSNVTVKYPHENADESGCYYSSAYSSINIIGPGGFTRSLKSYASWDVIMHEYGHHVQYYFDIINSTGDEHNAGDDLAEEYNSKDKGIRLAWGEAYPTVFGTMAQQYYATSLSNINTVGDKYYNSYNGSFISIEGSSHFFGEACEGSIIGVLWDMFDSATESHDSLSLSHSAFWNIITNSSAVTMSEFAIYFVAMYEQYADAFGKILSYYNMAVSALNYNRSSAKASWRANGMSYAANNQFWVVVYDQAGFELVSRVVTTDYIIFTATELENMRSESTVDIVVFAYQTNTPTTGGYRCAAITVTP